MTDQPMPAPVEREEIVRVARLLAGASRAAVAYDSAIAACGDDPNKMASFCTAQGDDLDSLYAEWICKAEDALAAWDALNLGAGEGE